MMTAQSSIKGSKLNIVTLLVGEIRGNTITVSLVDDTTIELKYNDLVARITDLSNPKSYEYVLRGRAPIFFATNPNLKLRQYGWGPMFSFLSKTYTFELDNATMRCYLNGLEVASLNILTDAGNIQGKDVSASFPEWLLLIRTKVR